ncbi:MAG: PIG-L family deacetylase [Candidatus Omnitrophota bacterium]
MKDYNRLEFNPNDRILILAPHPDDEVLGCGGVIQRAEKLNLPLKIVFLTYGDNNQWSFIVYRKRPVIMPKAVQKMGLFRHDEAVDAARALGLSPDNLTFLGYPDFRTLEIWYSHWGSQPPARSMLTDVRAVPYENAYRPGAPYKADEILKDIKALMREFKPTRIFVSHPLDHNPDHRSLYLFTRIALWDLEKEVTAKVYPYLIHFKKWPQPYGYLPGNPLTPPALLAEKISWDNLSLNQEEIIANYNAIKKHRSQYNSSAKYLLSFIRHNELFGDFPAVILKTKDYSIPIVSNRNAYLKELPEELINEERAEFVGVEEEFISIVNATLVFKLKLSRPLGEATGVSLYLFGYKSEVFFSSMPKIHIKFGVIDHKIFDQDKNLPLEVIQIERKPREITLRIPLGILGNPDRILTSARTYAGMIPLDWVAWRVVRLAD